jgi:para-nitrobenzyl esterase
MNNTDNPVVETKAGKLQGQYEDGIYVFRGIPYAEPPVGKLRWMPPEPRKPWRGVRSALKFGAISVQKQINPGTQFQTIEPYSEDCLFLNVWSPGLDDARRPVLFWIHGGGFQSGAGSLPLYRGTLLAKRGDVVVVTINYRVGVLGFMNWNEITGGKLPASGNEGILDQLLALKWVKDNIVRFGGDPDNVTVFGESAGSMSISCMLSMDRSRGLFHKAIMESGGPNVVRPLDGVVKIAGMYLEALGLKSADVDALRSVSSRTLLSAHIKVAAKTGGVTPTEPVLDGRVIKVKPMDRIWAGSACNIPIISGVTEEETKFFSLRDPSIRGIDEAGIKKKVELLVGNKAEAFIETYRRARGKRGMSTKPWDVLSAIRTDAMFRIPLIRIAEAQYKNGQKAFNYLFTWKSPMDGGVLGACHTLEMGFVFGTLPPHYCGTGPAVERLSANIQDAWMAFARKGDPSCPGLAQWPEYSRKRKTMILGERCYVEEAPLEEERAAWDNIGEISPALALG